MIGPDCDQWNPESVDKCCEMPYHRLVGRGIRNSGPYYFDLIGKEGIRFEEL